MNIGFIKFAAQFFLHSYFNFYSSLSQPFNSFRCNNRIRIQHPHNDFSYFGTDKCLGARRRPPVMVARFEAHESCCTLSQYPGIFYRKNLNISNTALILLNSVVWVIWKGYRSNHNRFYFRNHFDYPIFYVIFFYSRKTRLYLKP